MLKFISRYHSKLCPVVYQNKLCSSTHPLWSSNLCLLYLFFKKTVEMGKCSSTNASENNILLDLQMGNVEWSFQHDSDYFLLSNMKGTVIQKRIMRLFREEIHIKTQYVEKYKNLNHTQWRCTLKKTWNYLCFNPLNCLAEKFSRAYPLTLFPFFFIESRINYAWSILRSLLILLRNSLSSHLPKRE